MHNTGMIEGVWIGRMPYKDSGASINGKTDMATSGEIMVRGHFEAEHFVLEEVLRIAVVGYVGEGADRRLGEVTIVGPLPKAVTGRSPVIEQDGGTGDVSDLELQVHYRQLTLDAIERGGYLVNEREVNDVRIPPVVRMEGKLHWEQLKLGTDQPVRLTIDFQFQDDRDSNSENELINLIEQMTIASEEIEFYTVADAQPDDSPEVVEQNGIYYWLCTRPESPCGDDAVHMLVRRIPIRFVCLFNASFSEQAELLALCTEQVHGVCEAWRSQTVLGTVVRYVTNPIADPDATPVVEFPGLLLATEEFFDDQANWNDLIRLPTADAIWVVDIFIAREIIQNGVSIPGVAYDLTVASAGVVLSFEAMRHEPAHKYLLAHELGHCLGLEHPGLVTTVGGVPLPQGSPSSVMEIINHHAPMENSADNCVIFGDGYPLLNPLARAVRPLRKDCLRPLL